MNVVELFAQAVHLASQVGDVASQFEENLIENLALALVGVGTAGLRDGGQHGALRVLWDELAQHVGGDLALFAEHGHLFCDVLQLAHVARPFVVEHELLGLFRERDFGQPELLSHLQGEEAEQQDDVLATVAQGWHLDGDGVEPVVEVFAEASLADGFLHVDVGGSHNAHVGLADLCAAHADVFPTLEHSQQSCLCGHGQLAHLVEEDGALVGHAEIALALADGACERPFLVAEQLAVDGSLRDGAAVDGEIALTPAGRIVVDESGDDLLADATLSDDQHR